MKLPLKKTLNGLIPASEEAELYLDKWPLGDIFEIEIKHVKDQRNYKLLQKYWVMLSIAIENQEVYKSKEQLHEAIKYELGIFETRYPLKGKPYRVVGSVAMDKMSQPEFETFYSKAIDLVLQYVITGTDRNDLMLAVNEIIGFT